MPPIKIDTVEKFNELADSKDKLLITNEIPKSKFIIRKVYGSKEEKNLATSDLYEINWEFIHAYELGDDFKGKIAPREYKIFDKQELQIMAHTAQVSCKDMWNDINFVYYKNSTNTVLVNNVVPKPNPQTFNHEMNIFSSREEIIEGVKKCINGFKEKYINNLDKKNTFIFVLREPTIVIMPHDIYIEIVSYSYLGFYKLKEGTEVKVERRTLAGQKAENIIAEIEE